MNNIIRERDEIYIGSDSEAQDRKPQGLGDTVFISSFSWRSRHLVERGNGK